MRVHGSSTRLRWMMKKLLLSAAVVLLWAPNVWASTIVDFTGPYDLGWTATFVQCTDGSVSKIAPSVVLNGCDDGGGNSGYVEFTHAAHADGTVSFAWAYESS